MNPHDIARGAGLAFVLDLPDDGTQGKPSVPIRCQDEASVGVTFSDRFSFDADSMRHAGELRARRLPTRADEIVARSCDSELDSFSDELAVGGWSASVTTWLEAGESTASPAADIRSFLAGETQ
ncbi:DUF6228 family protein [Streptomyces sp. MNP-20]|uniref:DUF6228 family protein n=1 Tax=Streptomyces sp. MNP-20 TaxID=2721165 RepID=UPI0020A68000|nr:DUF6228 family protein [Streptomyces sp. MNP-20]